MDSKSRIDYSLATGENISSKSTPSIWVSPLTTRRALFLMTIPCSPILFLKIHLVPIMFSSSGFLPYIVSFELVELFLHSQDPIWIV